MFNILKNLFIIIVNALMKTISIDYITAMVVSSNNKSLFQTTTTKKIKYCCLFYYLILAFYMIRTLFAALVLNGLVKFISLDSYFEVESYISFGIRLNIIDRYSAAVVWPLYFMGIAVDYVVHFQRRNGVRQCCILAYELIVVNRENFHLLNPGLSWKNIFSKCICKNENSLIKVTNRPLAHFSTLKKSIRQRAVLFTITCDLIAVSFYFFSGLCITALAGALYIFTIWPVHSFVRGLFDLVDVLLIGWSLFHSFQLGFFFGHFANLLLYVLSSQQVLVIKQLNRFLKKVSQSKKRNCLRNQNKLSTFLKNTYLPLYHWIVKSLDQTNNEIVSVGLLVMLLTQFGFNVYSVCMFTLMDFNIEVLLLLFVINIVGTFFMSLGIRPMIAVQRTVRSARHLLLRSQLYLNIGSLATLRLQLKTMTTSRLNFAFTVGPLGVLTTKSIYEVDNKAMLY